MLANTCGNDPADSSAIIEHRIDEPLVDQRDLAAGAGRDGEAGVTAARALPSNRNSAGIDTEFGQPRVRVCDICAALPHVHIDGSANQSMLDGIISSPDSTAMALVIAAREVLVMLREVRSLAPALIA